jgi:hypothetical protein
MGRPSKPWYSRERRSWYTTIGGKRRRLGGDDNPEIKHGKPVPPRQVIDRFQQLRDQHCGKALQGFPPQLVGIPFVERYVEIGPCVYFLVLRNEVVYVGQTVRLPVRLRSHIRGEAATGPKVFDQVFYLSTRYSKLDELEEQYIRLFDPPLNRSNRANVERNKPDDSGEAIEEILDLLKQMSDGERCILIRRLTGQV